MGEEMVENMVKHSFTITLSEADSERFEAYLRRTGIKKLAVAQKAIVRYLDENEQKSEN